jgi:hypothetical protein
MKIPAGTKSPTTTPRSSRYRRAAGALAVAGAAALPMLLTAPASAAMTSSGPATSAALPSEVCAVAPSLANRFAPNCGTNQPSRNYTAQFVVLDSAGLDITWTLPPGVATSCGFQTPCASYGCHRGDNLCVVSAKNDPQNDQYITVSATISLLTVGSAATGSSTALATLSGPIGGLWPMHVSSTAFIAASCGTPLCHTQ